MFVILELMPMSSWVSHYGIWRGEHHSLQCEILDLSYPHRLLYRNGNLEVFLEEKTGVEVENILAYLADGRRLKDENIRDLAGVEDQVSTLTAVCKCSINFFVRQTIYVFNKRYLDLELEQVLRELHEDPVLQPLVEGKL